jgi:hypothetical protein
LSKKELPESRRIAIARDLGPTGATEAYQTVVDALDTADGAPVNLVLEGEGAVSALSLQLLASTLKTASPETLVLCDAALESLQQTNEFKEA